METHGSHKGFIILLPDRIPFEIPVEDHAFHIVSQNVFGNAHIGKTMDHSDEQIFLSGIGEELHIPLTAVMADHGEAGHLVLTAVIVHHIGEPPVHLECFARFRGKTAAPVSLGFRQLPLGRHKKFVGRNIILDRS